MLTKKFSLKNIAHICPIVYNVYMCNPELERQPKSNLEDRAKEVLGYIETIDFLDATLDLDKTPICRGILYKSYVRKVLDRLPENVGTYIHAPELPWATSTRGEGDTWYCEQATFWANEILSPRNDSDQSVEHSSQPPLANSCNQ